MAETRRSKRRSSILKSLDTNHANDARHLEKRRVSFNNAILVKEFHKSQSQNSPHVDNKEQLTKNSLPSSSSLTREYTVEANESFYQMSTPIGMKKRRISGATVPNRLSIIPAAMEKSFYDDSDFEVFEEESPGDIIPRNKLTLPEKNSEKIENQFGASLKDNFGEEVNQHLIDQLATDVVDMSLTLEEEQLSSFQAGNNDTMSSTIHQPLMAGNNLPLVVSSIGADLSVVGKAGLTGTNEMDPTTFPVSLLTPPKPPIDESCPAAGDSSNPGNNIVKELIKESVTQQEEALQMSENKTVYGGLMSMTCDDSMVFTDTNSSRTVTAQENPIADHQMAAFAQPGGKNGKENDENGGGNSMCDNSVVSMDLTSISMDNETSQNEQQLLGTAADRENPNFTMSDSNSEPLVDDGLTKQPDQERQDITECEDMELTCLDEDSQVRDVLNSPTTVPDKEHVPESTAIPAATSPPKEQFLLTTNTLKPLEEHPAINSLPTGQLQMPANEKDQLPHDVPAVITTTGSDVGCETMDKAPTVTTMTKDIPALSSAPTATRKQLKLPPSHTLMGKRRIVLSSTAVTSKHLAVGSLAAEQTPKKVSIISQMKSPYLTRSASAKKESNSKRKTRKTPVSNSDKNTSFVSPYNLRNSPSRQLRKKHDLTSTDDSVLLKRDVSLDCTIDRKEPTASCNKMKEIVKPAPQPSDLQTTEQSKLDIQEATTLVHQPVHYNVSDQAHETLVNKAADTTRVIATHDDTQSTALDETFTVGNKEQNTHVENTIRSTFVVDNNIPHEQSYISPHEKSAASSHVQTAISDHVQTAISDDLDSNWMNEDLSIELLIPPTPTSKQTATRHTPGSCHSLPKATEQTNDHSLLNPPLAVTQQTYKPVIHSPPAQTTTAATVSSPLSSVTQQRTYKPVIHSPPVFNSQTTTAATVSSPLSSVTQQRTYKPVVHSPLLCASKNAEQTHITPLNSEAIAEQRTYKPVVHSPPLKDVKKTNTPSLDYRPSPQQTRYEPVIHTPPQPMMRNDHANVYSLDPSVVRQQHSQKMSPDSTIQSPGIIILDGTINQTVLDVDLSEESLVEKDCVAKAKRLSIGRKAMDRLLGAMPNADVTLHLEAEYDKQQTEETTTQVNNLSSTIARQTSTESELKSTDGNPQQDLSTVSTADGQQTILQSTNTSTLSPLENDTNNSLATDKCSLPVHCHSITTQNETTNQSVNCPSTNLSTSNWNPTIHCEEQLNNVEINNVSTIHQSACQPDHLNDGGGISSSQQSASSVMYPLEGINQNFSVQLDESIRLESSSDVSSSEKSCSYTCMSHSGIGHVNNPNQLGSCDTTATPITNPIPKASYMIVTGSDVTPILSETCKTMMVQDQAPVAQSNNSLSANVATAAGLSVKELCANEPVNHSEEDELVNQFGEQNEVNLTAARNDSTVLPLLCSPGVVIVAADPHSNNPVLSSSSKLDLVSHSSPSESHSVTSITADRDSSSKNVSSINGSSNHALHKSTNEHSFQSSTNTTIFGFEKQYFFIEYLETLHSRFQAVNDALFSRIVPEYSDDNEVTTLIKYYHTKTKCCMFTVRCIIDFIRLNDMADSVADVDPIDWGKYSHLPSDDSDKNGTLMQKALWLQTMAKDVSLPLYKVLQDIMKSVERCFGWTLVNWDCETVQIDVRSQVRVNIQLDTEDGKVPSQKIKHVSFESLEPGSKINPELDLLPLNFKTILEIPVMMQSILQCV